MYDLQVPQVYSDVINSPSYVQIFVNGILMEFLVDTGSAISMIKKSYLNNECKIFQQPDVILTGVTGHVIPILGTAIAKLNFNSFYIGECELIVCDDQVPLESAGILGRDFFIRNRVNICYSKNALNIHNIEIPLLSKQSLRGTNENINDDICDNRLNDEYVHTDEQVEIEVKNENENFGSVIRDKNENFVSFVENTENYVTGEKNKVVGRRDICRNAAQALSRKCGGKQIITEKETYELYTGENNTVTDNDDVDVESRVDDDNVVPNNGFIEAESSSVKDIGEMSFINSEHVIEVVENTENIVVNKVKGNPGKCEVSYRFNEDNSGEKTNTNFVARRASQDKINNFEVEYVRKNTEKKENNSSWGKTKNEVGKNELKGNYDIFNSGISPSEIDRGGIIKEPLNCVVYPREIDQGELTENLRIIQINIYYFFLLIVLRILNATVTMLTITGYFVNRVKSLLCSKRRMAEIWCSFIIFVNSACTRSKKIYSSMKNGEMSRKIQKYIGNKDNNNIKLLSKRKGERNKPNITLYPSILVDTYGNISSDSDDDIKLYKRSPRLTRQSKINKDRELGNKENKAEKSNKNLREVPEQGKRRVNFGDTFEPPGIMIDNEINLNSVEIQSENKINLCDTQQSITNTNRALNRELNLKPDAIRKRQATFIDDFPRATNCYIDNLIDSAKDCNNNKVKTRLSDKCYSNFDMNLKDKQNRCNAVLLEDTVIPPRCESNCRIKLRKNLNSHTILVEPNDLDIQGVHAACTLMGPQNLKIRVVNTNTFPVTLKENCIIGSAEPYLGKINLSIDNARENKIDISDYDWIYDEFDLTHLDEISRNLLCEFINQYKSVFSQGEKTLSNTHKVQHQIITENVLPIAKRPYRVPYFQREILRKEIDRLLESGVIRHSQSAWSAPVVIVKKKSEDGTEKIRMCIDYRALNAVTKRDFYPLPNLNETLELFGKSNLFSTFDVNNAYHQIPLAPEAIEISAFSTPDGHYEYTRMPFGLVNAPSTFQRFANAMLAGLTTEMCMVYLDDIIVFNSNGVEDHIRQLALVFQRLIDANITLKPSKCKFLLKEVKYLGHIISEEGIKPDPQKVECINSYPIPRNVKDVRAFLGLAGWYRKFIKNFSEVALPLTNLTKKSEKFEITPEVIESMNILKKALTSESILIYPDFTQPFILATDSSDFGTGSILSQLRNGFERPIAFASRKFNKAERNYSVSEKECNGLVAGIKAHKYFLYGRKFTIVTDHRPLKWLLNLKDPTSRLARWALLLSEYDFDIIHRPGRKHGNVDALSRIHNVNLENNINNVDSVIKYVDEVKYVNPHVQEVKGDLFNCPEHFSLAHCVSQDFCMSQGIARTFKNCFGCVNELIAQNKNLGEVAELILPERNIYYMITKTKYYNKPSYQNVFIALNNLKKSCQLHYVNYLGMPRIACGLDHLNWEIVLKLINFVFKDTNIKIYIYVKERNQNDVKLNILKVDLINEPLCVPVWDRDNIKQEQYKDNFCSEIIDYLNGPENELYLDYFLDNDKILYKLGENGNKDRLVLPRNYINKTLYDFHCLPFAGHQGQQKTMDLIKTRFFWLNMRRDIIKFCTECHSCCQRKTSPHMRSALLQRFPDVSEPFERTNMDIVGPLVTTRNNNKYILTFQDYFTKYVEAIPIPDQKAETIAKIFVTHIIVRHGTPKQLITDQGSNFLSILFREVCRLLQIEKLQTTPFNPSSNSIERVHRVFKDILSHYIASDQTDWDEWIPYILLAYRSSRHSSTGYSPFFLLHGRDPVLPYDDIIKPQVTKYDYDQNYASEMLARLNNVYTQVKINLEKSAEVRRERFNKNAKERTFELGDLVYMLDMNAKIGLSRKLRKPWVGPFRIIEKKGPVTFKIRRLNTRKDRVVHANKLKLCTSTDFELGDMIDTLVGKDNLNDIIEENTGLDFIKNEDDVYRNTLQLLPFCENPVEIDAEEIIGEEVPQPLRRSTRIRKPPDRLNL